jgi:hypothetical protein
LFQQKHDSGSAEVHDKLQKIKQTQEWIETGVYHYENGDFDSAEQMLNNALEVCIKDLV